MKKLFLLEQKVICAFEAEIKKSTRKWNARNIKSVLDYAKENVKNCKLVLLQYEYLALSTKNVNVCINNILYLA